MRLKILTTTLLLVGIGLILAWPVVVGKRPAVDAPRLVKVEWGKRVLVYFGVTCGIWLSTAMSAFMVARQSQREYLANERENLKSLVEGSLKDHERS